MSEGYEKERARERESPDVAGLETATYADGTGSLSLLMVQWLPPAASCVLSRGGLTPFFSRREKSRGHELYVYATDPDYFRGLSISQGGLETMQ